MTQYGTGKTLLMEAKAKWLLNAEKAKWPYFSFPSEETNADSMLNTSPKTIIFSQNPKAKPIHAEQKVVMIVFHDKEYSLVTVKLKNQFKGYKNVHIQGLSGTGKMIF